MVPWSLPFKRGSCWLTSAREAHPAVECRRSLLATAAWLDPHGVRRFLHKVAETNFLFDEKPGEPHLISRPLPRCWCVAALLLHSGHASANSYSSLRTPP